MINFFFFTILLVIFSFQKNSGGRNIQKIFESLKTITYSLDTLCHVVTRCGFCDGLAHGSKHTQFPNKSKHSISLQFHYKSKNCIQRSMSPMPDTGYLATSSQSPGRNYKEIDSSAGIIRSARGNLRFCVLLGWAFINVFGDIFIDIDFYVFLY